MNRLYPESKYSYSYFAVSIHRPGMDTVYISVARWSNWSPASDIKQCYRFETKKSARRGIREFRDWCSRNNIDSSDYNFNFHKMRGVKRKHAMIEDMKAI